ncbi:PspC domain-containing protein [Arthrobacter sp. I2-34]|uniref:PspC domain-containing protein n=1 Tax=Arthrobacter hankyongi TaxID=2904801 RepID=A0ABS9L4Y6_9MICC|nr:ATP-binding protein [Arthrobacter hankyongi]MCG2621539.1 PspC domain-containing protein [Arthrobacter hankyongi]
MREPLVRSDARVIAGVCGGLARHLGISTTVCRLGVTALTLVGGAGILLYVWLWLLVPTAEEYARNGARSFDPRRLGSLPAAVQRDFARGFGRGPGPDAADGSAGAQLFRPGTREIAIGGALLLAAAAVVLQMAGVNVAWGTWLPLLAIAGGAVIAWMQLDDARRTEVMDRAGATGTQGVARLVAGLVLVVVGIFPLVSGTGSLEQMWHAMLAALAMLAGVLLVLAPWVLKYWRDLETERSGRVREQERAEIAAHLHDSVLQTLALIQNRASSEQDVTRLARAQERELREWLYRDRRQEQGNLVDRIKAVAADVEDTYGHPVQVVAVGDAAMTPRHEALVQATREAVQNAAKHAGGTVSVYLEATPARSEVFVRDRGPGFELAQVPPDRLGVRESLIGRMERHGGSARIRNTGNGTEVELRLDHVEEGTTQ